MSEEYQVEGSGSAADRLPVGETLRRAREARGETIGDVVNALKLTHRQVEAMEKGRFELLPGPAFVRGFVRNYGRHLGLDTATLLAGLEHDIAAPAVELAPVSNADGVMPSGGSARPAHRPVAAVVLLLVAAVVAGWYFDWFKAPDSAMTTEAMAPAVEPSATVLAPDPQVVANGAEDTPDTPSQPAPPVDDPDMPPAGGQSEAATPDAPPAAAAPAVPPPASAIPPPTPPAPAAPAAASEPAAPASPEQLRFRLQGESWIEVRDGGGSILFSGVAPAGSTRTVQGKPPFAVVVGNASQVAIEYRGRPIDLAAHTRVGVARVTVQ